MLKAMLLHSSVHTLLEVIRRSKWCQLWEEKKEISEISPAYRPSSYEGLSHTLLRPPRILLGVREVQLEGRAWRTSEGAALCAVVSSISAEDATVDEIDWEKVAHKLHGKRRTSLVERSPMDCRLAWTNEFRPHVTQTKWGKEEVVFFLRGGTNTATTTDHCCC